jgi:ABC-type transporter Mla subunit MlaD
MKGRTQDFALGLTAIVVLALFVGTILFLYPALRGGGHVVEVHFPHEGGMAPLKAGSAVLLGGAQEVGRVREVRIRQLQQPRTTAGGLQTVFAVKLELNKDVPLYGNCEISTDQPAVGGAGFVSILNVGTPDVPLKEPVQGLPPQSLAAAIGALSRRLLAKGGFVDHLEQMVDPGAEGSVLRRVLASLDDLNALTGELRVQMSPNEQKTLLSKVHLVLDDLKTTTTALREELTPGSETALLARLHVALERLTAALTEATDILQENRPVVHDTLTSVEHAIRTVDQEMLTALKGELDPANPASLLGKLHVAMDRVNASLDHLQTMTATGEQMVVLGRPALEKMLGNFQGMSEQLRLTSQEVLLNPSKLIWGPSRQRDEQLVAFQAARSFAEAATQLDTAAARLEAMLKTLPPDGRVGAVETQELQTIRDAVRASFERFEHAEQTLWDRLK